MSCLISGHKYCRDKHVSVSDDGERLVFSFVVLCLFYSLEIFFLCPFFLFLHMVYQNFPINNTKNDYIARNFLYKNKRNTLLLLAGLLRELFYIVQ